MLDSDPTSSRNEYQYRRQIVDTLHRSDRKAVRRIFYLFDEICPGICKDVLRDRLEQTLQTAKNTGHWGHNDFVNIGAFRNTSEYNTLLFHESCHQLVKPLNGKKYYDNGYNEEEDFCHRFSRNICQVLSLPYSSGLEEVGREFMTLGDQPTEIQIRALESFSIHPTAAILGFQARH